MKSSFCSSVPSERRTKNTAEAFPITKAINRLLLLYLGAAVCETADFTINNVMYVTSHER